MRFIEYSSLVEKIKEIVYRANFQLPSDVKKIIQKKRDAEEGRNKKLLNLIIENYKIAEKEELPLCQDSGIAIFFVEMGKKVAVKNGSINEALDQAVREIYKKYSLRKSVVSHPLKRENTQTNTPPIIYYEMVEGDRIKISFMPKGGGSENMSRIKMFNPSAEEEEIVDFIFRTVKEAGPNPCPPVILGIGMGGTFDYAPFLAKKALLRDIGERNKKRDIANLENRITRLINENSDVGIQGLGGKTTVLDTFIEIYPCHIASLPVAVNINCHSSRHSEVVI
ncbi:MAG: fumarate hydratase [Candidatus Mcinerneyibacterium aminivorans]|uniref:Fumarate hydratase n=1 Tax=Candidatus Mcinerneyibacterium aminivorans TaxID=2703815 RepID=A0A5D0MJR9_9BACT|nr:MAG: fumarate hydratase [Candidatus Mcinerneyibacterium aminivorans]